MLSFSRSCVLLLSLTACGGSVGNDAGAPACPGMSTITSSTPCTAVGMRCPGYADTPCMTVVDYECSSVTDIDGNMSQVFVGGASCHPALDSGLGSDAGSGKDAARDTWSAPTCPEVSAITELEMCTEAEVGLTCPGTTCAGVLNLTCTASAPPSVVWNWFNDRGFCSTGTGSAAPSDAGSDSGSGAGSGSGS